MDNSKQQSQTSRFFIAAALSLAVLFGWSYFFAPKPKPVDNANTAQNVANTAETPVQQVQSPPVQNQPPQTVASTPDNTPNKIITIKTPLYEVKLDSKGAVATSWVLLKDKSPQGEKPLFAEGSGPDDKKPLELISSKAAEGREFPFRLFTGDQNLDGILNERNYEVSVNEQTIEIAQGQEKPVVFTLRDGNGLEVTKSFLFRADSYVSDLQTRLARNGQIVPNTRLLIGASIGDNGLPHHDFYRIESEGVASVDGAIKRHQGYYSFTYEKNQDKSSLSDAGNVNWAGVGDAYFTMTAIPANQMPGLEYRATKYDVEIEPFYDGFIGWVTRRPKTSETRHLVTALVPINTDGSTTKIYTGTKDYFALHAYNNDLSNAVGRTLEFENLINFSNYRLLRPITSTLSIPILYSLNFLNNYTHNYGVAIIIFTFLFYSLLFPLRWSQSKSFKKASGNAPKMKEVQDKLKDFQKKGIPADDPRMRELQMEQLRMMKGAVPLGGCLPMLLQFPLLIAFFTAVTVSLAIRQASFLWLPDLSAGDPFHLLEFAFVVSMVLSMKFTPTAATVTPEQQTQQKMMTYLMPLMMIFIMWNAPAGLLLYWFFGNIISFGQQMIINRINKTEPPKEEIVPTVPKNAKKVNPKLSTS
ncbi:MAG TPA: membrane protein insertase YidC [Pyrinomonadaceae bacterium]|jgi:YidC/Oxa1 family membrane protein insertase